MTSSGTPLVTCAGMRNGTRELSPVGCSILFLHHVLHSFFTVTWLHFASLPRMVQKTWSSQHHTDVSLMALEWSMRLFLHSPSANRSRYIFVLWWVAVAQMSFGTPTPERGQCRALHQFVKLTQPYPNLTNSLSFVCSCFFWASRYKDMNGHMSPCTMFEVPDLPTIAIAHHKQCIVRFPDSRRDMCSNCGRDMYIY